MAVLVLWHEPATVENRHTRPDAWRCLVLERATDWRQAWPDHAPTRYELKRLGDCAPVFFRFVRSTSQS
jgi:hypothetical protein